MVGRDFAALRQHCHAFEHEPEGVLVRAEMPHPAPADHLHRGSEAFERSREWFKPWMQALADKGWTEGEVMRLPTNRAGTDAGLVWSLSGFDLTGLEVSEDQVVAVTRDGNRMVQRRW